MASLIQLVHHQTVVIFQTVMTAGGDGGHARGRRGLVDDWGLPTVGLDSGECRAPGQSTVVSDAAGAVVVAAAKIVMPAVGSSDRSRMLLVSVQPSSVRGASWQVHPSCIVVSGRGSCAA